MPLWPEDLLRNNYYYACLEYGVDYQCDSGSFTIKERLFGWPGDRRRYSGRSLVFGTEYGVPPTTNKMISGAGTMFQIGYLTNER